VIFLTVGTSPHQFDRLVKAMDDGVGTHLIEEEIFAQIGDCRYRPKNIPYAEMLTKSEFDAKFKSASCIVGHAGMGTISMSLEASKPILVMPRMAKYKEHVNDHQVSTADMFEKLGHVLVAHSAEELAMKIGELRTFVPAKREATPQLVAGKIAEFLEDMLK